MRSFSPVLVVLIGAVLAQANVHHRRYVNDQDSENQIDTTGTPVEEPERHYHHHRRHYHGRHHHFDRVHRRSRANLSEAEETIEFHRFYMRNVRALAEESGLCNEDVNTLLNIIEESRPPFKKEDRSQWTEEQWQKSKEECDQRKQLVRAQAFAQIQDQIHLTIFFDKLEAQKKQMKENIHKYIVGRLTRIAVRSGLNDSQIEKFVRELESHKPVGVHWRPGMSQNEKRKNIEIHVRNWLQIKEACLRDATEAEQVQFNRFFEAVEKDFARSMSGDHPRMRHHQRRHRHYHRRPHVDEDFTREHVHRNSETENVEPEMHHHRHNRRRPHYDGADRDFEESPRRTHRRHHETEVEELAPLRRHRSDEIYDSEERDVRPHHHHRRHYHHRRPNYVDSEERVEYVPERHHRRHHRVREEVSDSSEEQRDEEFEPRRHHHRHHHNRHEDREQIDDSKVRSEPYRHYRRHVRRGDVEE